MSRLPNPCPECASGDWCVFEKNGAEGVKRCGCARGRFLLALDKNRGKPIPTRGITEAEAATAIERLSIRMSRVPSGTTGHAEIADELQAFVCDGKTLEWLVQHAPRAFGGVWPGTYELRAFYCSRFRPRDGAEVESGLFPEGFQLLPGETPLLPQIEAPKRGDAIAANPEDAALVVGVAQRMIR